MIQALKRLLNKKSYKCFGYLIRSDDQKILVVGNLENVNNTLKAFDIKVYTLTKLYTYE